MNIPTHAQLAAPDARLAKAVSHFYCVQHARHEPVLPQQLLPTYQMLLVINLGPTVPVWYGGQFRLIRQASLLGPIRKVLRYELPPGTDMIVVNFSITGFYWLIGRPMQHFCSTWFHSPQAVLNSPYVPRLRSQLLNLSPGPERLALLSECLHQTAVSQPSGVSALLDSLADASQREAVGLQTLSGSHGLSVRSLQLRCQTYLGCSWREISRFLRFDRLVRALRQQPALADWQALVAAFGYHDQSHLIRDFRHFVGLTPNQVKAQILDNRLSSSNTKPVR